MCLAAVAAPAQAAPVNDAFGSATVAGPALPVATNGNNVDATAQSGELSHTFFGGGPHKSVWYRWTAPVSQTVVIDVCETEFDTVMGVYTGTSVSGLTTVAKSDNDCVGSQGSLVQIEAVAGTTYRIAIDGFNATAQGVFTFRIRALAPPSNDNFANRQTIGPGLPIDVSGTTLDAGPELDEPDHGFGQARNSIWYQWTPTADTYAQIDTCDSQADIVPAVYTGNTLASLGLEASDDDCDVAFPAIAGTSYKIALDSIVEGASDLEISVLPGPANDNFANRQTIGPALPASASGTLEAASAEPGEPDHIGFGTGAEWSIWYQWTPSATGPVRVDTCGSEAAVRPAVYTGTAVGSLTQVAQSNDECSLTFTASAGTAYKIALDSFAPSPTELLIRTLSPPANDAFANRQTVGPALPVNVAGTNLDATSQVGEPDHRTGQGALHSIWYGWTPSAAAQVKASVCQTNPDMEPQVAVYTGTSVTSLTQVATGSGCSVTFNASAGVAYKVAVDGSGEGATHLNIHVLSPPANDNFANRQTIGPALPATVSGTKVDATAEAGEPDHGGFGTGAQRSVWYGWTPASGGSVNLDACGSAGHVVVAVYTGSALGSLTLAAGNDGSCAVSFTAVAGAAYKIAFDGFVDSTVSFTLASSGPPPDPPDPPALSGTNPASGSNYNAPLVLGSAEAGATVRLYSNSTCTGSAIATSNAGVLASPGIEVSVADNTTATFYATAQNADGISVCSASGVTYAEVTPPPPPSAPSGLSVTPASGSNDNNPVIRGDGACRNDGQALHDRLLHRIPCGQRDGSRLRLHRLLGLGGGQLDHDVPRDRRERGRALDLLERDHLRRGDAAAPAPGGADGTLGVAGVGVERQQPEGQRQRRGRDDGARLHERDLHRVARRDGHGRELHLARPDGVRRRQLDDDVPRHRSERERDIGLLHGVGDVRRGHSAAPARCAHRAVGHTGLGLERQQPEDPGNGRCGHHGPDLLQRRVHRHAARFRHRRELRLAGPDGCGR